MRVLSIARVANGLGVCTLTQVICDPQDKKPGSHSKLQTNLRLAKGAKLLAGAIAMVLCLPLLHAQTTTTYTIGAASCGPASATIIDCYSMPLTVGTTTQTAWVAAEYMYTTEDFLTGLIGDYEIADVSVVSAITYKGIRFPTEIRAKLTGVEGTVGTGTLDLKISYTIGKTGRYTTGLIAATSGGVVKITT